MTKQDLSQEEYEKLLEYVNLELRSKGLKSTTMDSIAQGYKISKRTLYEIFVNKDQMIEEALEYWHKKTTSAYKEIFSSSDNIMETILRCFFFNRDIIQKTSLDFFRDFHSFVQKRDYDSTARKSIVNDHLISILTQGVNEGYFRRDLNLNVQCLLLLLQMESLRRMEEIFPDGMSLLEIFDSIIITFLRGISTQKGIETLDQIIKEIN